MTKQIEQCPYDSKLIGKRIAEKRMKKGLSQSDLATMLDKSQELIAKIELGSRNISNELLAMLVDVLDTNTDFILLGIDTKNIEASKHLHLSNGAIDNLHRISEEHPEYMTMLSRILEGRIDIPLGYLDIASTMIESTVVSSPWAVQGKVATEVSPDGSLSVKMDGKESARHCLTEAVDSMKNVLESIIITMWNQKEGK